MGEGRGERRESRGERREKRVGRRERRGGKKKDPTVVFILGTAATILLSHRALRLTTSPRPGCFTRLR